MFAPNSEAKKLLPSNTETIPKDAIKARIFLVPAWIGIPTNAIFSWLAPTWGKIAGGLIKAGSLIPITYLSVKSLRDPNVRQNRSLFWINTGGLVGNGIAIAGSLASAIGQGTKLPVLETFGDSLQLSVPVIFSAIAAADLVGRQDIGRLGKVGKGALVAEILGMAGAGAGGVILGSNPTLGNAVISAGLGTSCIAANIDGAIAHKQKQPAPASITNIAEPPSPASPKGSTNESPTDYGSTIPSTTPPPVDNTASNAAPPSLTSTATSLFYPPKPVTQSPTTASTATNSSNSTNTAPPTSLAS
ncbi:MAG: hypothetical protein WCW01_04640 [Gammaproteobacteria bacterium]